MSELQKIDLAVIDDWARGEGGYEYPELSGFTDEAGQEIPNHLVHGDPVYVRNWGQVFALLTPMPDEIEGIKTPQTLGEYLATNTSSRINEAGFVEEVRGMTPDEAWEFARLIHRPMGIEVDEKEKPDWLSFSVIIADRALTRQYLERKAEIDDSAVKPTEKDNELLAFVSGVGAHLNTEQGLTLPANRGVWAGVCLLTKSAVETTWQQD